MLKKIASAWLLTVLAMGAFGQHANATLFSMPKSLKSSSPLAGVEMSLPIWAPSTKSYCVMHLTACQRVPSQALARQLPSEEPEFNQVGPQPEKVALFGLPKPLRGQLDRVPQDTPILAPTVHAMFCLQYPKDCEVRKIAFRGTKLDLVVMRTKQGDYLLDNLWSSIQAWSRPGYHWVRMQSASNPKIWSTVKPAARSA